MVSGIRIVFFDFPVADQNRTICAQTKPHFDFFSLPLGSLERLSRCSEDCQAPQAWNTLFSHVVFMDEPNRGSGYFKLGLLLGNLVRNFFNCFSQRIDWHPMQNASREK